MAEFARGAAERIGVQLTKRTAQSDALGLMGHEVLALLQPVPWSE